MRLQECFASRFGPPVYRRGPLHSPVVGMNVNRGKVFPLVVDAVLERLIAAPDGLSKHELIGRIGGTSSASVQRALTVLRDEHGAPIEYDGSSRKWVLHDPSFRLPMRAPEPDDVRAVLIAEALLEPIADESLRKRLRRLAEQLDDRLRERQPRATTTGRAVVHGRTTLGTRIDPQHLATLLDALSASCSRRPR